MPPPLVPPPRIVRLEIEGLRVIDRLELELRPMNVLIGENGSGKSTVLEALEILRKAATLQGEAFIESLYQAHDGERMFRLGQGGVARSLRLGVTVQLSTGEPYRYALALRAQLSYLMQVAIFALDLAGLTAFDEPDGHLHPAMVARIVELAEESSTHRTVVLTTHSDRLLDALSDPLSSVILFERDTHHRTQALRPNRTALEHWHTEHIGLGRARAEGYGGSIFTEPGDVSTARGSTGGHADFPFRSTTCNELLIFRNIHDVRPRPSTTERNDA